MADVFSKTMPAGFGSPFGKPSLVTSPKKMSQVFVNKFDEDNPTALKLKQRLQDYMSQKRPGHQTQDVLFSCLTEMLNKVAMTNNKKLQEKQI